MTNKDLIEGLLWIQDRKGRRVRFLLNQTQQKLERERTGRDLILKARQEGVSSYYEADQFISCIRRPTNAALISHEKDATRRLFARVKYFIRNLEIQPDIQYNTKQDIFFRKRNSNYYIGTEGQRAVGRGDTLHDVHVSEAAFFQNLNRVLDAVSAAVPLGYGNISIETTANGRGNDFYKLWQAAKNGESVYTPHFFPWFADPTNRVDDPDSLNIRKDVIERMKNPNLTDEEKDTIRKHSLDMAQIAWRRYQQWNHGDRFPQEYPENDTDCFLQSGRPVFRHVPMARRRDMVKGKRYYAGLDGAEGTDKGDNSSFAVMDMESPAQVVYEYTSKEPVDVFCQKISRVLAQYDIILGVEKNGLGLAHVNKLQSMGVQFYPWETTGPNRTPTMLELEEAWRKEEMFETYEEAKNEALDMFYDDKNRPTHPASGHDDRVFARVIAYQMRKYGHFNIRVA